MSVKRVKKYAKTPKKKASGKTPPRRIGGDAVVVTLKDGSVITSRLVKQLPKNPVKGQYYSVERYNSRRKKRILSTAEATGKQGFGKFRFRKADPI